MKKVNVATFKKKILKKGKFLEVSVYPYFSNENKMYGRVVIISDRVQEPTFLTHRYSKLALILPWEKDVKTAIQCHFQLIQEFVGVMAPVLSIYSLDNKKIGQVEERVA